MMFLFHIAFALGLIALALGVYFLVWACGEKNGAGVAKTFGYIIVILAIISLLCTFYYNMKLWKAGYYQVFPRMMTIARPAGSSQPTLIQKLQTPQRQMQKAKQQLQNRTSQNNQKLAAQKHRSNQAQASAATSNNSTTQQ